jgi:paired amphipathic helix protein Sin3a
VSRLFQNQEDLLAEFGQFLPEATNDNSTEAIIVSKGLSNEHAGSKRGAPAHAAVPAKPPPPSSLLPPAKTAAGGAAVAPLDQRPSVASAAEMLQQQQQHQHLKRPLPQPPPAAVGPGAAGRIMQPPAKKPRMGVLKDVSLAEAGKYGSLTEYAFFDKVRKALKNAEVYENFLRCLVLFNQEVVTRSELVQLITPFLNKVQYLLLLCGIGIKYRKGGAVLYRDLVTILRGASLEYIIKLPTSKTFISTVL